jgi:hypothetical protein
MEVVEERSIPTIIFKLGFISTARFENAYGIMA